MAHFEMKDMGIFRGRDDAEGDGDALGRTRCSMAKAMVVEQSLIDETDDGQIR
jgi:hypothetical protein